MRDTEIGHHHPLAGAYLPRYSEEANWREDNAPQTAIGPIRLLG